MASLDQGGEPRRNWKSSDTTNSTRKIANRIFAMPAELAAIPVNPNAAAISATTRKIRVQYNINESSKKRFPIHLIRPAHAPGRIRHYPGAVGRSRRARHSDNERLETI